MKIIMAFFLTIVFLTSLIAPAQAQSWNCRNDLEIRCSSDSCVQSKSFTPMDISFDDSGSISICAYTGCWEGSGKVSTSQNFTVITGRDLPFSSDPSNTNNVVVAIDTNDNVAVMKAAPFAHPFICKK